MTTEKVTLSITALLADLQNGYTRTSSDKNYQGDSKSIEEKYGLTKSQVKEVFQHEKLRNKKTVLPKEETFILVDDTAEALVPTGVTDLPSEEPSESVPTPIAESAVTNESTAADTPAEPIADAQPQVAHVDTPATSEEGVTSWS